MHRNWLLAGGVALGFLLGMRPRHAGKNLRTAVNR
jgi:hypothetical protein